MSRVAPGSNTAVNAVELPSFKADVCYVHGKIPPSDTLGHRAEAWDVSKPDFTCSMACFSRVDDTFIVRLHEQESGKLFAESFWTPDRPMASVIDAAVDSSRYFALRIDNPETGGHVFIGVGFHDRDVAGSFKMALHEHARYLNRRAEAAKAAAQQSAAAASSSASASSSSDQSMSQAAPDMSLKGSIRVQLPGMAGKGKPAAVSPSMAAAPPGIVNKGGGLGAPLLAPPPSRSRRRSSAPDQGAGQPSEAPAAVSSAAGRSGQAQPAAAAPANGAQYDEDDFGEFVG